ncbi:MAG: Lipopolysaccharide export system ATP-binding protein LptB [Syntrophorhabdaceae bacterium PtaU1.Bin034]|nr:MAG: Lipopolysaccharide export system ATP-binding protein LptB [Syntrophorhabdaceae bacterium PtaU1.Bin034]
MSANEHLLEVVGVSKQFGGLTAVDNVTFRVGRNEIRGIIGPNGAGKTTFFNVITGELKPSSGKIYLNGEDVTGFPPHRISRRGMSRTFQLTFIFPDMTVFDCVWVGVYSRRMGPWNLFFSHVDRKGRVAEKTEEICRLVGIEDKMDEFASNLSYGDQKVLEIAMALSTDPSILLLDEPTQGVGPREADDIVALIGRLSERMSIVLIEHNIDIIMRICHHLTVLSFGKVIAEGSCKEVAMNQEVQRVYLGEEIT